jgi:hypothetical protein
VNRLTLLTSVLLPALVLVLFDVPKPLHIDDAAYHLFATQMAERPLDPYGFSAYWYHRPYPANEILAPALLPYWWSAAIRLFGDRPWLWKLWLLPFVLLFTGSLYALFRRFCPGLGTPLVWMTVLSPTFLPSLNLMLDVPALGLSLTGLALFLRACDRNSFAWAALSGFVVGLAAQTKYTGLAIPAVLLIWAVLDLRPHLWVVAVLVAVQVFVSWEFVVAMLYGESHFLLALRESGKPLEEKLELYWPMAGLLGGIGPPAALLGLAALGARRSLVVLGGVVLFILLLLAHVHADFHVTNVVNRFPFGPPNPLDAHMTLAFVLFGLSGLGVAAVAGALAVRVSRLEQGGWLAAWRRPGRRAAWFLVLWLLLETVAYPALTPFAAVRRLMAIVIVGTLLAGWLAARTTRRTRAVVWGVTAFSAVLGLVYTGVDYLDARAEEHLVEAAQQLVAEKGGEVWYVGHWGFQYHAERRRMKPVVAEWRRGRPWYNPDAGPIPLPPPSRLRKGDWLIVPGPPVQKQWVEIEPRYLEFQNELAVSDPVRLRTVMCYYCGETAIEYRVDDARLIVHVYRVTEDFTPVSGQ